jgi:hypothetical protein
MRKCRACFMIIIALLMAVSSCSKKGRAEKEPNNTFSTANEVVLDERIIGVMGTPNDRDFYLFECKQESIIDIQLSGVKGINLAFKIWKGREDPKLVKWVDDNRKSSPERVANLSVVPGTYYIEIFQSDNDAKKSDKENTYELTLKSRDAISEESEPNDSLDSADSIQPDKEITGFFSPAYNRLNNDKENLHREEDWYVMDVILKSDTPLLMDLSITGVSGVNSILYLCDAEGNEIAVSDNGGAGEPESITGAGIKTSGSYYAMVTSKGYTANHEEPYTLKASLRERDSGAEMEPNNDFEAANSIVNNVIVGKIASKEDRDLFFYQTDGGPSIYRIELRPPEDMDAMLTLYSIDREPIIDIGSVGKGRKDVYPDFFTEKGFYIAVAAKSGDKPSSGEYLLSVTPLKNIAGMEREPNNEISQANSINEKSIVGFTSYRGDKDYFLLTCDSRIREKFEVRGVKDGAIRVSITDPLGYITKSVDVKGERKVIFSEMIDKKGYVIIESVSEDYNNPYIINLRGVQ